jgi:hypothetical protein
LYGVPGPVADEVEAQFAIRAFVRDVDFAGRHARAVDDQLEVVDQRFDLAINSRLFRKRDTADRRR